MVSDDALAKVYISKFVDMDPKTIAGIGMELESYLSPFSTSQAIREALTPAEGKAILDWSALNGQNPFDVILVFPEAELEVLQPLFCLMTNQLVENLTRRAERTYDENELPPVLLMCEEFPRLGKVEAIETGLTTLRSRGVTIVLFLQSFASLEKIYGKDSARVIRENCAYQVIFGCTDVESQHYVSDLLGTTAVIREGTSEGAATLGSLSLNFSRSYSEGRVPLVQPHALRELKQPIVCTPHGPFLVKKHLVFNGERAFGEKSNGWTPSQNHFAAPLTHNAGPQQSVEVTRDTANMVTQAHGLPSTGDFDAVDQKIHLKEEERRKTNKREKKDKNARAALLIGQCVMEEFPELKKNKLTEDCPELKQFYENLRKVKNLTGDTEPPPRSGKPSGTT